MAAGAVCTAQPTSNTTVLELLGNGNDNVLAFFAPGLTAGLGKTLRAAGALLLRMCW